MRLCVAALALGLAVTACGADDGSDRAGHARRDAASELSGTLDGGGAGSQENAQAAWLAGFQAEHPGTGVTYDPVGSEAGRTGFIDGTYSFAGIDSVPGAEHDLTAAAERCDGQDPIRVPAYVSPIAVIFNLEGIDSLRLSAPMIADIFAGKITTWKDPAIAALNANVSLPDEAITPVHRLDDSGTTESLTSYLAEAGEGGWTPEPDELWPSSIPAGKAADGTAGVLAAVVDDEGAIGYADASAAGNLGVVSVQVGEEFNTPSAEGAARVVANSPGVAGAPRSDMAVQLDRTTTEAGAYPLLLVSYLIACRHYVDPDEAGLVRAFLRYILSEEGQQVAADEAGAAPLEPDVAARAAALVDGIASR